MSMDTIIRRIRDDADREARSVIESARQEAASARAAAAVRAEEARQQAVLEGKKRADLETAQRQAQALLDARETIRHAREDIIRECFHAAGEELARIRRTPSYPRILAQLITAAVEQVGDGSVSISAARQDHALLRDYISARGGSVPEIHISGEDVATMGGVIVRSGTGHVAVNNTFEERLGQMRSGLVFELARFLSGRERDA